MGFPGETEDDFQETLSLLDAVRFEASFSFKYSPRPGTPALKLLDRGDEVPAEVAQDRLIRLQRRQRQVSLEANEALLGQVVEVLVDGASKHDADEVCGRTGSFKMVNFPGELGLTGQTVAVRVTRAYPNSLKGERV